MKENVENQIQQYVAKGYAHAANEEELITVDPKTWYLPIEVVINPKKPGKVRIIWDASATVQGVSLNSTLLKGPEELITTILPSIYFRFRQFPYAVSGDIREMFHQVRIRKEDRNAQRFLWRTDSLSNPTIYIMDVATFGSTCSPASARYVKDLNAATFKDQYPRAYDAIINEHFVDDFVASFESIGEAKTIAKQVKDIHSNAGFCMRNWISNRPEIVKELGELDNTNEKTIGLPNEEYSERVLGMLWTPTNDSLAYSTAFSAEAKHLFDTINRPTKRQVLKSLMSLFDPLGLISNFTIHGKILMQNAWRKRLGWDEPIDEDLYVEWKRWIENLKFLYTLKISRCYFAGVTSKIYNTLQMHILVDASEQAYCTAVYFRIVRPNGSIECSLVSAKSKVAPLKTISIPRLELCGAVLGTRLAAFIQAQHNIHISKRYFWCDSKTVLGWIIGDPKRYESFVACRIGEILSATNVREWNYVPSKLNVADDGTKWSRQSALDYNNSWFQGPTFLFETEDKWPQQENIQEITEGLKAKYCLNVHTSPETELNIEFENFDDFKCLLLATAQMVKSSKNSSGGTIEESMDFSKEELIEAENYIWKLVQHETFPTEIDSIRKHRGIAGNLRDLSPFLDEIGVLRSEV